MSDLKIPENWKWVKMKNVSKLIRGVNYKKNEASRINEKGKKFIIRGNNIQNGKLEFDNLVYVLKDNINEDQFIRKNDIIITMSSGSKRLVGKAARVKKDMDGGFGAFCGLIRPMEVINGIYLGYFFQSNL